MYLCHSVISYRSHCPCQCFYSSMFHILAYLFKISYYTIKKHFNLGWKYFKRLECFGLSGHAGKLCWAQSLHLVLNSKTSWAHWATVCPGSGLMRWHDAPWLLYRQVVALGFSTWNELFIFIFASGMSDGFSPLHLI